MKVCGLLYKKEKKWTHSSSSIWREEKLFSFRDLILFCLITLEGENKQIFLLLKDCLALKKLFRTSKILSYLDLQK